ncbi:MAG: chromosome segregation protein SMC [Chrysiogenetes bacterium]|nr:chromosome segregation protein SMC [Chrysiogenetes bacterium]
MKIKQLQAHGFKSFADGIRLDVHEGVSAIVGPNGCGKSNIVDAVRWVMGEISARHLRGQSMQDVIFGGTQYRKSMGRAEVSVILSHLAESLPEPYNQFTELEVTRRLYRTGESEYLINRKPARRRDVAELFLEAGVGTRTISIIEQGQVTEVVKAKPAERRFFIEQAAGILKYKSRRESALRKLEATKQNLNRVKDVLNELTRQRATLERQAEKAQRYREIVETLREADLASSSAQYIHLDSQRKEIAEQLSLLETEKRTKSERLTGLESDIAKARLERAEREHALAQAQETVYAISSKISELEAARRVAEEGIRIHSANADRASEEASRLDGRRAQLEEEEAAATAERDAIEAQLETLSERLAAHKEKVDEQSSAARTATEAREGARKAHHERISERDGCVSRLEFAEKSKEETARRIGKLEAELSEITSQINELSQTSFGFAETLKASKETFEHLGRELAAAEEKLGAERARLDVTEAELRAAKENLSDKATRLSSLRDIERRYEGYGKGVQAIMLEAERRLAEEGRNGIYGMVADVLKTRPEYERAVESLLGERLQHIVVKTQNEGIEAVEFLKSEAKGRSSFIPLTLRPEQHPASLSGCEGVVGTLREVVDVKEGYDAIADYLLGDAVLVDRLDHAVDTWGGSDHHHTLVTLDGDVVDRFGVITGGTVEGAGTGVMTKKREIEELTGAVEEASEAVSLLEARRSTEAAQVASVEGQVEEYKVRLHRVEIEITSQEKDVQRIDKEREQVSRRREDVEAELSGEHNQLAEREEEINRERIERDRLEVAVTEAQTDLARADETHAAQQQALSEAVAALEEAKVEAAGMRERAESLGSNVVRLARAIEDVKAQHTDKGEQAGREREQVEALSGQVQTIQGQLEERASEKEEAERRQSEARSAFDAGENELNGLEEELAQERSGIDEVAERVGNCSISLRESEMKIQRVVEDVTENYELELADHVAQLPEEECERLSQDELREELKEEAERQRRRLKAVGSVNVDAIEEYDQVLEREQFLQGQHDDLITSIADLEKAISKINKTTRERFRETYEAINARFQEVFPKLFRGGKARLELTDPANLLETGVEIIAHPPGKKLGNMDMLSGGEKTLTAVALLLAIFLIAPAPFVILDEVDAALDDANVDRFNDVVRELINYAQVIVITHNKQTMEIADTLVGVTMEEAGVSKLVSVQMAEAS